MKHNWEYKPLGDVCDKDSSNLIQKNLEFSDTGFDVFGASGSLGKIDYYQQAKPYVGIVKDGSGVGRCNLYPAKSSLTGTMQYILAKDSVTNSFLCYLLKSLNLSKYVNGAAIPHIYFKDYKKEIVPVPPKEVQKQIVTELDKINEVIEDCRELLRNLDALAQSLFHNFFGDIHEYVPLSYYVKALVGGKSLAGKEFCKNRVLKSGAVTYDYFDKNSLKFLPLDYIPNEEHLVKVGNLIISRMNTAELVGACAYVFDVDDNVYLPDRLWRIEYNTKANPIFLWKSIISHSAKEQIIAKASGTSGSMKNISKPLLLSIQIKKVPLSTQEEFANRINQIESQKKVVEQTILELQTLLDSRMDYWFN